MKNNLKRFYGAITAVSIIAGFMAGSVSKVYAEKNPNPGVMPPQSHPHGMTYGEWSARWWQWNWSLPVDKNPSFDANGNCSNGANGQLGPVWFLTGVTNTSGTAVRNCTVPAGKALFFPILNAECSTLEDGYSTYDELRDCTINKYMQFVTSFSAEIDRVPIQNLQDYRAPSPLFTYGPLPDHNLLQYFGVTAPAGATSPSVADGYYLMLAPLSVGQHTIHFTGEFSDPVKFNLDITYILTVAPPGKKP